MSFCKHRTITNRRILYFQVCATCLGCDGHDLTIKDEVTWSRLCKEYNLPFKTDAQAKDFFATDTDTKNKIMQKYFTTEYHGPMDESKWAFSVLELLCSKEYLRYYFDGHSRQKPGEYYFCHNFQEFFISLVALKFEKTKSDPRCRNIMKSVKIAQTQRRYIRKGGEASSRGQASSSGQASVTKVKTVSLKF